MTRRQTLISVGLWILSAAAVDLWLLLVLLESQRPGSTPGYSIPCSTLASVGCLLGFAASIRKHAATLSIPTALAYTFLGCIPIWLIMESTVT